MPLFNPHTNPGGIEWHLSLERASHLPKVTQPISGGASIQIHVCLTLEAGKQRSEGDELLQGPQHSGHLCTAEPRAKLFPWRVGASELPTQAPCSPAPTFLGWIIIINMRGAVALCQVLV